MTREVIRQTNPKFKQLIVGQGSYTSCAMNEEDYLAISPIWKKLRENRLKKDHFQCVECGNAFNLQVHHIRYPDIWGTETIDDLVTLCDECHKKIHNKEGK